MIDWRTWLYQKLSTTLGVTSLVPAAQIYGSGSIEGRPKNRPFIVITLGPTTNDLRDGDQPSLVSQFATLWIHDAPGDYLRISSIQIACQLALDSLPPVGGVYAVWQGDSQDLSDDSYGTIMRNSEYRLVGKVA